MRHRDDELPLPVLSRSAPRSPLSAVAPPMPRSVQILAFATLALIAGLAFLAFQRETTPIAVSGTSASIEGEKPAAAASPVLIQFPSELVIVTNTPVPSPEPTATYAMSTEVPPPTICMTSTPKGTICSQPKPPLPTATPIPPCPVKPEDECVHPGGPVTWLPSPTATPGLSTSSNQ